MKMVGKLRGLLVIQVLLLLCTAHLHAARQQINFNRTWRFSQGEQDETARQPEFDDAAWQAVQVPHDCAISGPFNPQENGYAAKLPWKGVGWYR